MNLIAEVNLRSGLETVKAEQQEMDASQMTAKIKGFWKNLFRETECDFAGIGQRRADSEHWAVIRKAYAMPL